MNGGITMFFTNVIEEKDIFQVMQIYADDAEVDITDEWKSECIRAFSRLVAGGGIILGAYIEEELVGCLSLQFLHDLYPGYSRGPYSHMETIIVKKAHQDKGIGTALVQNAINICKNRGVTYVIAQTDEANFRMQRVYEKSGLQNKYVNYHIEL